MPEWADEEHPQLGDASAFEWRPLIDTLPQPLLHGDIPMWDFIPHMFIRLNHNGTTRVNKLELFAIVTNPTGMHTGYNKFPSEVVLEPD